MFRIIATITMLSLSLAIIGIMTHDVFTCWTDTPRECGDRALLYPFNVWLSE